VRFSLRPVPLLADKTRCEVPELVRRELMTQLDGLRTLTLRITDVERQIAVGNARKRSASGLPRSRASGCSPPRLWLPTVADARSFRSGREFAAFLGLVPQQSGTGGRIKLSVSASVAICI